MSSKREGDFSILMDNPRKKRKSEDAEPLMEKVTELLDDRDTMAAGLVYLLKEVTENNDKDLLTAYLSSYPDCSQIFILMQLSIKLHDQDNILLCLLLLERILLFTASPESNTVELVLGGRLVTTILSEHLGVINYSLSSNKPDALSASALRLLTVCVMQGKESLLEILDKFDFGSNRLVGLVDRSKVYDDGGNSVRICFIKFALSFLVISDTRVIARILSLKKLLPAVFRKLSNDPPDIIVLFLTTLFEKVVKRRSIARKDKLIVFDRQNVKRLTQLLQRDDQDELVKEVVFDICSGFIDPKFGLVFPTSNIFQDLHKTNNPVLLQLVLSLMSCIDQPPVMSLISRTLSVAPDLFYSFLYLAPLELDPKPTLKWLTHTKLVKSLLNTLSPMDLKPFSLPLETFVSFICPPVLTHSLMSNGVQNPCLLIKSKCLKLINCVLDRLVYYGGDEWKSVDAYKWQKYCDGVFSRLPNVKILMSIRHVALQLVNDKSNSSTDDNIPSTEPVVLMKNEKLKRSSNLLLGVTCALRRYQSLVPTILAQAQINPIKLLTDVVHTKDVVIISDTLEVLLDAPVEMFHNAVKGTDIMCLFQLSEVTGLCQQASDAFVKCMRSVPCLLDYEYDLMIIFHIISSHLYELALYSNEEKQELKDFIVHSITEVLKRSSLYLWSKQDTVDEGSEKSSVSLCPLLISFIDNCGRAPKVSRLLLLSDMILKLVHSSADPVSSANTVLTRLNGTLLQYNTKGPINKYLQLLHSHLWVWSSNSEKDTLELSKYHDDSIEDVSPDKILSNPSLMREHVMHQLIDSTSGEVFLQLLSDEELCYVTTSLLAVIPLPLPIKAILPKLLAVKWRVLLTYNVLWQQCFYSSSTSCSMKELLKTSPLCDPYLQTVFFNSEFYDVYRFLLISKQLVSLVRLASSYPKSKSVRKVATFCVKYFLRLISFLNSVVMNSAKIHLFIKTQLSDIAGAHLTATEQDDSSSSILNLFAELTIELSTDCVDELFLSYFTTAIEHSKRSSNDTTISHGGGGFHSAMEQQTDSTLEDGEGFNAVSSASYSQDYSSTCDSTTKQNGSSSCVQLLAPLSRELEKASHNHPQLKYNVSLFNDLATPPTHTPVCQSVFNVDTANKLLSYCTPATQLPSLFKLKILSAAIDFYSIEDFSRVFIGFCSFVRVHLTNCSKIPVDVLIEFLNLSRLVLLRNSHQVLNFYNVFIHIAPAFREIVLLDPDSEELTSVCLDSIEMCACISYKVKVHLKRLLYKILVNNPMNKSNFHIQVIGCLSSHIGDDSRDMWLEALESLLKELRQTVKKKASRSPEVNEKKLSIVTKALCMTLQNKPNNDDWLSSGNETYMNIVKLWDKTVMKALRRHRESSELLLDVLSHLFSFLYVRSHLKIATPNVCVSSIYHEVWSLQKLGVTLTGSSIRLLVTVARYIINDDTSPPDTSLFTNNHLIMLLCSYTATLSTNDMAILYLILCYEKAGISLSRQIPFLWGEKGVHFYMSREGKSWLLWEQPTEQEVMSLLNEKKMLHSIRYFPYNRELQPVSPYGETGSLVIDDESVYDPCFLLPLFSTLLSSTSVVNCLSFIKRGLLSFIITATSSTCVHMRKAAYYNLSLFNHHLTNSNRFTEKPQVTILMEILCNSVPDSNARLPVLMSSFIARAASLFVHTDESLFPVVADQLIKKPFLDMKSIPLYPALINSPVAEECCWMIEFLCDGLVCPSDYQIYRRNNVLSHLMALYNSPILDEKSKSLIVNRLMKVIVDNHCALQDCCWNFNLLSWIHASLPSQTAAVLLMRIASKFPLEDDVGASDTKEASFPTPPPFIKEEMALLLLHLMNTLSSH